MQRHRDEKIGLGQNLPPGARHPEPERLARAPSGRYISADGSRVARRPVLEPRHGAGTGIDRRIGDRVGRMQALDAEIIGKRRAEPLAIGPVDEIDAAPAGRAKCPMRLPSLCGRQDRSAERRGRAPPRRAGGRRRVAWPPLWQRRVRAQAEARARRDPARRQDPHRPWAKHKAGSAERQPLYADGPKPVLDESVCRSAREAHGGFSHLRSRAAASPAGAGARRRAG